jgi:RNA polymerase sigma factor (sigma-70 family)
VNRSPEHGSGGPEPLSADQAAAVEKLFRAAAPRIYPRALLLAQGDRAQADDLIQLVFQAAIVRWETVGQKDPGDQMKWLYRVLRNKAADAWRANGRERPLSDLAMDEPQSSQDTAHHVLCSMALNGALKVMKEMPTVRHRVVCLLLLNGLPTRDVAGMLGIEQSTVRGHLKAAREELAKEIGPILPFTDDDFGPGLPLQEGR